MSVPIDKKKWAKKAGNKRIGMSSVVSVKSLGSNDIEPELGNKSLTGGHASSPKQGRRS